jgi:lysozyme
MKISPAGIALICAFESCRLEAYADASPRRIPTVGYGHCGAGVMLGQRITQERAQELLRADLVATEAAVSAAIRTPMTQGMFDALCSLAYNIGAANFKWSTLAHLLNNGQTTLAGLEFHRWNYAGAKELNGLTKRRAAELALFNGTENA